MNFSQYLHVNNFKKTRTANIKGGIQSWRHKSVTLVQKLHQHLGKEGYVYSETLYTSA